jgi:hypothetical protein
MLLGAVLSQALYIRDSESLEKQRYHNGLDILKGCGHFMPHDKP